MRKRKQTAGSMHKPRLRIPNEEDWDNYKQDLDQQWAHDQYCGRSNEEMQGYFSNNPIEAAADLRFMPEIPFRYYMLGYKDLVMSDDLEQASDAASCFLNLIVQKLEEQPRYIVPIMPYLLSALEYVAQHQSEFDAPEDVYGNFLEKFVRIQELYAEVRGRYRKYP